MTDILESIAEIKNIQIREFSNHDWDNIPMIVKKTFEETNNQMRAISKFILDLASEKNSDLDKRTEQITN